MRVLNELLEANSRFAEGFEKGDLPMPPARKVAVLACMDARLHPERFLGLDIGDAHVIRNAGGRPRMMPSARWSSPRSSWTRGSSWSSTTPTAGCSLTFTSHEFLTFADLEESVAEDVRRIRESPFIADDIPVSGFVYDVRTGRLKEVVGPTAGQAA
jgi:carbonic anhydrase